MTCEHNRPQDSCGVCWPEVVFARKDKEIAELRAKLASAQWNAREARERCERLERGMVSR